MRRTRLRKFGKRGRKLALLAQIAAIWYLSFAIVSYLTSETGAYFNDVETIENYIHAAWEVDQPTTTNWDKSSLEFINAPKKNSLTQNACPVIKAYVQNGKDSESMQGPVTFEVYWIEKGNPKNGTVVYSGEIPPLKPGESSELSFQAEINGSYKFKAYQRPNHPGKGELWSDEDQTVTGCENQTNPPVENEPTEPPEPEQPEQPVENEPAEPIVPTEPKPPVEEDIQPPTEVKDLKGERTSKGNGQFIKLIWVQPEDEDFSHVNIYIDGENKPYKKNITGNSIELNSKESVTYRITTVDIKGNESNGQTISIQ